MNRIKKRKSKPLEHRGKLDNSKFAMQPNTCKSQMRKINFYVVLFVLLWLFCSFVYGDVFNLSRETSYFAWDKTLMTFVLCQDCGWLYAIGRFLLQSYRWPLLGSAVLSLMLTVCTWLFVCILPLKRKFRCISLILPWGFLSYFIALDYSINYHRETSLLMALPFFALVVLCILATVKFFITHKKTVSPFDVKGKSATYVLFENGISLFMFVGISVFCLIQRDDLVRTCRMFRQLEKSGWEAMIDEATSARRPSRSVAALYSIALAETGQLEHRAFEIPFDFPQRKVVEKDGTLSDGVAIYTLDADFYAGLPNSSYHNSMETLVKNGPQLFLLKRMARAALVNGEKRLCWKYLQIIDRNPFEHGFVDKYKSWLNNSAAMKANSDFVHVYNKMPLHDSFEQIYRKPLFLGYNVALTEGRSVEALNASLMALLYSKDLDGFIMRARLLGNEVLPEYFQQAVLVKSVNDGRILGMFPTVDSQMGMARLKTFVREAKPYFRNQKEGQKVLAENWQNYFPYYMYFENIPTEEQEKEHEKQIEKGGVN